MMFKLLYLVIFALGFIPAVWFLLAFPKSGAWVGVKRYLLFKTTLLSLVYARGFSLVLAAPEVRTSWYGAGSLTVLVFFQWWLLLLLLSERRAARK